MATLSQKTIVVIDDDADTQDALIAFFKQKGARVLTFSDAESAMTACATEEGRSWDVIVSDLNLPRGSGRWVVEKVREIAPALPVIVLTGTRSAETAVQAIYDGAFDFIVKPIHFPQLQISVERAAHFRALQAENEVLKARVKAKDGKGGSVVGKSANFLAAVDIAQRVANSNANVLITGESGTGKEVIARYIHNESKRSKGPFIAINCSAIPENLLESELFGHAKGAFTGAFEKKEGLFESAQDGTLFLDEIGDLSMPLQAKLLRVLQEKKIKRVGENKDRAINARVLSATHKDLHAAVLEGTFREDLFFRLNVIPIQLPPLRERMEDIVLLADIFLERLVLENGSEPKSFSKDALKFLMSHDWPGNVRELENAIERAVVLSRGSEIHQDDLCYSQVSFARKEVRKGGTVLSGARDSRDFILPFENELRPLEECIQSYIEYAVQMNGGGRDRTAKILGIDRKTLYRKLKQPEGSDSVTPQAT